MSLSLSALEGFLGTGQKAVLVEISRAKGSTPREKGAFMLVGAKDILGTIGGGQLEYSAVDAARLMLKNNRREQSLQVVLGPETGQCCGGRVSLTLNRLDDKQRQRLRRLVANEVAQYPHIYIMGAGHVGRALGRALALLPVKTIIIDTRKQALAGLPENIETRFCALPEAEVRLAPPGSAFVIVTHDHALDFMIAREALAGADFSYVGMIGSKSKRAAFASWLRDEGHAPEDIKRLICPIGGDKVKDKRPEIIAALVAGEILVHTQKQQDDTPIKAKTTGGAENGGEKTGAK